MDAILALVTPATRMVFLANPNNPTGTLLPQSEMVRLRESLPERCAAGDRRRLLPNMSTGRITTPARRWWMPGENTVMTRTFSKIFGIGGARLGWAYAPHAIVDVLNRVRPPFPVNNFAAAAGIAALREPGWLERSRAHNTQAKRRLAERLTQSGLKVHPSEANFMLVDFRHRGTGHRGRCICAPRGIIVRRVKSYGLPQCLRITIGTDEECNQVAEALTEFTHG